MENGNKRWHPLTFYFYDEPKCAMTSQGTLIQARTSRNIEQQGRTNKLGLLDQTLLQLELALNPLDSHFF